MDYKARELKRLALEGVVEEAAAKLARLNSTSSQAGTLSPSLGIPVDELAKAERVRQIKANSTAAEDDWQNAAARQKLDEALATPASNTPNPEVLPSPEVEHLRWWALGLAVLGIAGLSMGRSKHRAHPDLPL